jgi:(2Fe-2S) ferredoxin
MSRYRRHVFVCQNERAEDHPRGCCLRKNSATVHALLKAELARRNLSSIVRANKSGCLDACEHGVILVVYPDGIWYGKVTPEDVPEIIERTIIAGEIIERLVIPDPAYRPERKERERLAP